MMTTCASRVTSGKRQHSVHDESGVPTSSAPPAPTWVDPPPLPVIALAALRADAPRLRAKLADLAVDHPRTTECETGWLAVEERSPATALPCGTERRRLLRHGEQARGLDLGFPRARFLTGEM
jgi:hypothetical protein